MSKIYSLEGQVSGFSVKNNYKTHFIRKMLGPSNTETNTELKIASIIQQNPHKNLVNVYKVSKHPPYIDYQLLDTNYNITKKEQKNYVNNIRQGVQHLHKYNIVYIDFKNKYGDNIGYDKISKTYKIYDFDVSGILKQNRKEWKKLYTPPTFFNYKKFLLFCNTKIDLDNSWVVVSKNNNKPTGKALNSINKNIVIAQKICDKTELTKIDELLFYMDYNEFLYL